jgi:hypothetical protein
MGRGSGLAGIAAGRFTIPTLEAAGLFILGSIAAQSAEDLVNAGMPAGE